MVNFSIFNELSLPIKNKHHVHEIFRVFFFEILPELSKKGLVQVGTSEKFQNYFILEDITFSTFLGQVQDPILKTRLRSFAVNTTVEMKTLLIENEEEEGRNHLKNCDYFYNGLPTKGGLAYCDIWDTFAVSFNSDMQWDHSEISLQKDTIHDVIRRDITIKHASKSLHLTQHQDFLDHLYEESKLGITPDTFWDNREKNFPEIIKFCPEVENQIKSIDRKIFRSAISILRDIEIGIKSIDDFDWSNESQTVNNNPKLKSHRMFTINGKKVFFQQHLKLSNRYRMYFLKKTESIFIGYIGKHLPTKKF